MAISELHLISLWDDPRARLKVVRPKFRLQLLALSALFLSLLALVTIRVSIIQRSYDLENLRLAALKRDGALRELNLELAFQTQPERLRSRAEAELGLRATWPQQLRRIELGQE